MKTRLIHEKPTLFFPPGGDQDTTVQEAKSFQQSRLIGGGLSATLYVRDKRFDVDMGPVHLLVIPFGIHVGVS